MNGNLVQLNLNPLLEMSRSLSYISILYIQASCHKWYVFYFSVGSACRDRKQDLTVVSTSIGSS